METVFEDTGLEVIDLRVDNAFAFRRIHHREAAVQMEGLQRLSRALLEQPDTILQELVQAAIDLCDAGSAGISVETRDGDDEHFYRWIATAGDYSPFLNAVLPRFPSACGICLERDHPQHFTVSKRFFDILGVQAPLVTDGVLIPWKTEETRGTIFIMAHDSTEAFDSNDVRLMSMLADFAAMAFRQQTQQARLIAQERASAAAQMAHELAHQINNPLQSMTNSAFLIEQGRGQDPQRLGRELSEDIRRLSILVQKILSLPMKPQPSTSTS